MSYARIGPDSDVYVYAGGIGWTCCWCSLTGDCDFATPEEMLEHLAQHQAAGHKVPDYALERLALPDGGRDLGQAFVGALEVIKDP